MGRSVMSDRSESHTEAVNFADGTTESEYIEQQQLKETLTVHDFERAMQYGSSDRPAHLLDRYWYTSNLDTGRYERNRGFPNRLDRTVKTGYNLELLNQFRCGPYVSRSMTAYTLHKDDNEYIIPAPLKRPALVDTDLIENLPKFLHLNLIAYRATNAFALGHTYPVSKDIRTLIRQLLHRTRDRCADVNTLASGLPRLDFETEDAGYLKVQRNLHRTSITLRILKLRHLKIRGFWKKE